MRNIIIITILTLITLSHSANAQPDKKLVKLPLCTLQLEEHLTDQTKGDMIFINGLISSPQVFHPLIEKLKNQINYNLYTLALPPTGESKVNKGHSWKNISQCLQEFFSKKSNYTLVMHDLAVQLVMPIFDNLPAPKRIIIINGLIRPTEFKFVFPFSLMQSRTTNKLTSTIFPELLYKKEIEKFIVQKNSSINSDQLSQIYDDTIGDNSSELAEVIQGYPTTPEWEQRVKMSLRNPKVEQLVIWGIKDPLLKNQLQFLDETSKTHPKRTTYILKEGRHFSMWEFSGEVSSVIRDWMRSSQM